MSNIGTPFELVVSDVVKEMDPNANVRQGEWIIGPDGHRNLDVIIEGTVDGITRKIHIECKDYNPDSRPIGINFIDALESKHRDLNVDLSLLCSNAGFTTDAIRKSKRKGIGLIGVLREGDKRIRYRVMDEIYIRRIDIVPNSCDISYTPGHELYSFPDLDMEEITFKGKPVINWLKNRVQIFLAINPVVNGTFSLNYRFKNPIKFNIRIKNIQISQIQIKFEITGSWIAQRVEIDATCGLYDWIRRTIHLSPNPGKIAYKNVKFGEGGTPIKCPPDFKPDLLKPENKGEISTWISDIGGLDIPNKIPKLDKYVMDMDLIAYQNDLPSESYYS